MKKVTMLKTGLMVAAMVTALPLSAFAATGAPMAKVDSKVIKMESWDASKATHQLANKEQVQVKKQITEKIKNLKLDQQIEKKATEMVANLKADQLSEKKLREVIASLKLDQQTEKKLNATIADLTLNQQITGTEALGNVKVEIHASPADKSAAQQLKLKDGQVVLKAQIVKNN
ncbi:hypothetical protein [Paenibacillus apiarius]|uniref:Uncharacterized protein n=1 Tax=Paenibacillus apiarius TaxID=46240 RepID=A0ABT4DQ91_9BACL|nr:hypothetical protein [Paenibacillus apiarius]MCY9514010.1 hypothetical protein [Paenibacillus apiarius]MCY9519527.1 hypothetical protein [Paenibacillus apiarius]MCY9552454.1 hypothetical protein [Paenibacillus apiarius]MCY9556283.1 hypothetical protein [Paenibacillus apiarius]MCY9681817.1 hypothetical protein [Paenibacillus apiarius]